MAIFHGKEILLAGLKGEKGDPGPKGDPGTGGWSDEQIDLLEDFKGYLSTMKDHIGYDDDDPQGAGQVAARNAITALTSLIASLREQPEPEPVLDHLSVTPTEKTVTLGTTLAQLAGMLTVKAVYDDDVTSDTLVYGTSYTMDAESLPEGENDILIQGLGDYAGLDAVEITVTVTSVTPVLDHLSVAPDTLTVDDGTTLSDLADSLLVKAHYDTQIAPVTLTYGTTYTMTGSLIAGQDNPVTVSGLGDYAGLDAVEITVTVEQAAGGGKIEFEYKVNVTHTAIRYDLSATETITQLPPHLDGTGTVYPISGYTATNPSGISGAPDKIVVESDNDDGTWGTGQVGSFTAERDGETDNYTIISWRGNRAPTVTYYAAALSSGRPYPCVMINGGMRIDVTYTVTITWGTADV